MPLCSVAFVPV